jgi:hypothetical protein
VRKNGPIGAALASVISLSISSTVRPLSSWWRQISDAAAFSTRLTTNPGSSPHLMGFLRICIAKFAAPCDVSSAVRSPSTTSISRITEAG